ncbi:hypothetical protein GCM10009091_00610 [Pseudomonas brenneri]|jgi:hypothetical protein|uniref:DUF1329 domain-containing protein n=1 Tax=Pseudomonas brenneri TaxID=129817 RepID=A0A5B2V4R2_9PSED|nr:DUF1329 domain-containing protein [Pseudomonas brenneri]KAA2233891.1 DUF1329 domain-containing protein [Pseudomonas brenneri]TWR81875.1 DUF1329 domain-containing protein [Pseudomonas brenneri]GGL22894.1 hypothetical protein GCM10009091_00610 [Pseudomonas brenneri]SDU95023.1 Protein of unknown function [Pseudomonas brenneri]
MNFSTPVIYGSTLALLLCSSAMAAVSPEEAARLGTTLTPLGGEKAGNADGSIPAWTGGLPKDAGAVDSAGFLADPFANERALFTITAQNVEQYKGRLSPGQIGMFKRYPDYTMNVYPTHRSVNVPPAIVEAARKNALNTRLVAGGNGLENFTKAYPFPIPKDGLEVIWNHITRYRGDSMKRQMVQIVPDVRGVGTPVTYDHQYVLRESLADYDPAKPSNVLFYNKQTVIAPARLAGNVELVHETLDQVKEPRQAWIYNAGQRRVRRAPQVAYDGPAASTDGQRVVDNYDMFNGAPDRYDWQLVGKQELYIPYNSYKLDSPTLKYADITKAGHIDQGLARYELHRVWHVVATLKPGQRHVYAKRDFYIDEDSWQAAVIDHYDGRNTLWRVAEAHQQSYYNHQVPFYTAETLNDMISGRYLVLGLKNEEKRNYQFDVKALEGEFTPNALRQSGVR